MPYALINGCNIYYETAGEGVPLLFMHGGFGGLGTAGSAQEPLPWYAQFTERYRVITFDRRSSGRSSAPEMEHSLQLFAQDAYDLLRHLGIARAVVWGESAGVAIATTFALEYPHATTALILTDGAPWFSRDPLLIQRLTQRIQLLDRTGPEAAYNARRDEGTVGLNLFSPQRLTETGREAEQLESRRVRIRTQLAAMDRAERVRGYAAELRTYSAYIDFDVTGSFSNLSMPVLIIYGTSDTIFPSVEWAHLTEAMDNVHYVALEGGEHGCGREPHAIEIIGKFLEGIKG